MFLRSSVRPHLSQLFSNKIREIMPTNVNKTELVQTLTSKNASISLHLLSTEEWMVITVK